MKVNIGSGANGLEGFVNIDHKLGGEAYPLHDPLIEINDGSCDEIRASHVLEHFSLHLTVEIVRHWASKLTPGGVMKIAVPDFEWIAKNYLDGKPINVQGYTMGGQTDEDDYHKAIFDEECLAEVLRLAGLVDVKRWQSDAEDCSRLEVSLNLMATKPHPRPISAGPFKVSAVMSVPRLGFMDNFFSAFEALTPMGMTIRRHQGAYWEACLERTITATLAEDAPDAILTLDYDTVFRQGDVERMVKIMREHPEIDALAPIQSARHGSEPLMTMDLPLGVTSATRIPLGVFAADVTRLKTAHFGLTLIRTSSLARLPKPWLWSQPAPDQTWGEGRVDADIYFWRQWAAAGLTLYSANRVPVGHCELMIRWPGPNFAAIYQLPNDFQSKGAPADVWK